MNHQKKIAERLSAVVESSTLKMNTLAKELIAKGVNVINFTAGEPDFQVPLEVKREAIRAIENDFSKYTPVGGIPELKKALSVKFKTDNDLSYAPEEILVSAGAKHSIFNFLMAVVNKEDEILILSPYWVSYPEMVKIAGGIPVIIEGQESNGFKITPLQLKNAITPRTKALIFNSPSNPTGVVYSESEQRELAKVLEGTEVLVCSDEIYEKLVFEGKFVSFAALSKDAYERTVTVNGFSKAYAMTGWRLGYAAGPRAILEAMTIIQGQSTSNPTSIVQKAGLRALSMTDADLSPMVEAFKRRRGLMAEKLSQCKFCSFVMPNGAFYYFLNVHHFLNKTYNNSDGRRGVGGCDALAFYLLDTAQVVTVPGSGFGSDHHLRLSFAVSDEDITAGCEKIKKALGDLI